MIGLYDRVLYHKKHAASLDTKLIGESLDHFGKIQRLQESGAIDPQKAEILRRQLMNGCTGFVESGAIIPEFNIQAELANPYKLMSPEQKLLAAPVKPEPNKTMDTAQPIRSEKEREEKEQANRHFLFCQYPRFGTTCPF